MRMMMSGVFIHWQPSKLSRISNIGTADDLDDENDEAFLKALEEAVDAAAW